MPIQPRTHTKPVRFASVNVQGSGPMVHMILNTYITDIDIILLQEPNWQHIGGDAWGADVLGPVSNARWVPVIPVESRTRDDRKPRVMHYYSRAHTDLEIVHRS